LSYNPRMLQQTRGIVLKSVKYGETSLISNVFTRTYGVQTYLVQGVRVPRQRHNKAALLQPATLLDMVVYHKGTGHLQRIREFNLAYIYISLQEDIVRNSVALFSVEVLLRLLPEDAPQEALFDFAFDYFQQLDALQVAQLANFPLFFLIQCSRYLGYEIQGGYSAQTPYLNLYEGAFTENPPLQRPFVTDEEARALDRLLAVHYFSELADVDMNAGMRANLLDWLLAFLQRHTQHLGTIKSLAVLQAILH
jgi:DNA repair protein RecO (recombination protein O)